MEINVSPFHFQIASKVSVHSVRKKTNETLKKIEGVSEDDVKNVEETVQKLIDE